MITYTCVYTDVHHGDKKVVEHVHGENTQEVLEGFIQRREEEGWGYADIFGRSDLHVINQKTGDHYEINAFGELKEANMIM